MLCSVSMSAVIWAVWKPKGLCTNSLSSTSPVPLNLYLSSFSLPVFLHQSTHLREVSKMVVTAERNAHLFCIFVSLLYKSNFRPLYPVGECTCSMELESTGETQKGGERGVMMRKRSVPVPTLWLSTGGPAFRALTPFHGRWGNVATLSCSPNHMSTQWLCFEKKEKQYASIIL